MGKGGGGESLVEEGNQAPVIKTTLRIRFIISTTIHTIQVADEQKMTCRVD